jgi:uncharacterized membrane protein
MPAPHFDLVSHWRLPAPPERVWAALTDTPNWPRWWPYVRRVQTLGEKRRRIDWRTPLGYGFTVEVEVTESLPHERLRARSRGQMQGEGIWLLRGRPDQHTDVTYVWRVSLAKGWMRWLAPLLAPLFRWNHATVMRAGGIGLARLLVGA